MRLPDLDEMRALSAAVEPRVSADDKLSAPADNEPRADTSNTANFSLTQLQIKSYASLIFNKTYKA